MNKPTLQSILQNHSQKQDALIKKEREEKMQKLPEAYRNRLNKLVDSARKERRAEELQTVEADESNVVQVAFGKPALYIPKLMAASKTVECKQTWYHNSNLTREDGLNLRLDIEEDTIEVTIRAESGSIIPEDFNQVITAHSLGIVQFEIRDGDVVLAKLRGRVNGNTLIGKGSVVTHSKVQNGSDGLSLFFDED